MFLSAKPDSPHYQAVLESLFSQPPRPARGFTYDLNMSEGATQKGNVIERLTDIFRLHGAREYEMPLLMPSVEELDDDAEEFYVLDKFGEILSLPHDPIVPFARLAARLRSTRTKRFHILDTFKTGYGTINGICIRHN